MLEYLTQPTFAQQLNTLFRIQHDAAHEVAMELIAVTDIRMSPYQESFSLVFRGPSEPLLVQRTYRIRHDMIGTFDLFLVSIRQAKDGLYYEACFNRVRSEEGG